MSTSLMRMCQWFVLIGYGALQRKTKKQQQGDTDEDCCGAGDSARNMTVYHQQSRVVDVGQGDLT